MQCRDDGEDESRTQKDGAQDPYPALLQDFKEKHEEYSSDLGKCIGLAENARAEISQSGNREQDGAGRKDRNVTAEDHDGEFPRNLVQDGEHEENCAEQEL